MKKHESDLSNGWKAEVNKLYIQYRLRPYFLLSIIPGLIAGGIFLICLFCLPGFDEYILPALIALVIIDAIPTFVLTIFPRIRFSREINFSIDGNFIESSAVPQKKTKSNASSNSTGIKAKTSETGKMELSRIQQIISVPRLGYIKIVSGGEHMEIFPPKNRLDDVVAFLSSYAPSASVDSEER